MLKGLRFRKRQTDTHTHKSQNPHIKAPQTELHIIAQWGHNIKTNTARKRKQQYIAQK